MTPEYQEWILQAEILDLEGCPQCFPTDLPICHLLSCLVSSVSLSNIVDQQRTRKLAEFKLRLATWLTEKESRSEQRRTHLGMAI